MSRGYVKNLAQQLSSDKSPVRDENSSERTVSHKRSPSRPTPAADDNEGIKPNYVQNLIKAAELHKNDPSQGGQAPVTKKPVLSHNNGSSHHNNWADRKKSLPEFRHNNNNNNFTNKSPHENNCRDLGKGSPSSPRCLRRSVSSDDSEMSSQQQKKFPVVKQTSLSSATSKPPVNIGPKPSIPVKPPSLTNLSPRKGSLTPVASQTTTTTTITTTTTAQTSISSSSRTSQSSSNDSSPVYAQVNKFVNSNQTRSDATTTNSSPVCAVNKFGNGNPLKRDVTTIPENAEEGCHNVALRGSNGRTRRDSENYRDSVFNTIYDNAATLSAAELFDSSWSDSDSYKDFSDDDDIHSGKKVVEEKEESAEESKTDGSSEDKRFKIASELLKTEQDYVTMLHLLHVIFYTRLEEENTQQQLFPSDVLKRIFSNTKSIYLFHHDFLLPQLEARMKNWDNDPRIGDLMKKNAPFLKMYSEYIRNFNVAMKLLKEWMEKSTRFSSIIQETQKQPVCGSLSLQHHMLGPIQRVPRYEMLLKDYVKRLPADSPDMKDASDALDLVTKAACHSNEAMEKIETFRKLLDIYQSLRGVAVDFISPTREFVMQGPLTKISARSGEKQPRYIFLFNDLVLICAPHILGAYNVRCEMQVENMEVKPGGNMNIPDTFMVHSKQKAVEFLDETNSPERLEWEQKIRDVIETYKTKKRSIKQDIAECDSENMVPDSCLGKTAPVWIPDDAATMCMLCGQSFNMMRRRHHCRSCGKLACKSCCSKAPLEYMQGKIERVCMYCYKVIVNNACDTSTETSSPNASVNGNSPKKKGGGAKVKASDPGLISTYLQCSDDGGKTWQRLWVSAHSDFVLYTFRAHEDVSTVSVLPVPGYTVEEQTGADGRPNTFCLRHKKKCLTYQADSDKKKIRWVSILNCLVKAELPDDSLRLSQESTQSGDQSPTVSGDQPPGVGCELNPSSVDGQLDCHDVNDEKADVRSQYDNVDP